MLGVPVWTGLSVGVLLPGTFFAIEYGIEYANRKRAAQAGRLIWWTLTPQRKRRNFQTGHIERTEEEVDFDPRHGHYMKCGEIIISIASASIVFIPTLRFTASLPWLGLPMVLLGFTILYALAFMGLLTYFYEMQLQNPESFTMSRSCAIFGLGFGGLSCFAAAFIVLSVLVGDALSHGSLVSAGH
jgi:hypothetical protein